MKISKIKFSLGFFAFHLGCFLYGESASYFEKHMHNLSAYEKLFETSPEFLKFIQDEYYSRIDEIIAGFEAFEIETPAFFQYSNMQREFAREAFVLSNIEVNRILENINNEDIFYYFKFRMNSYSDEGFLIVRRGEIVYRKPINQSFFRINSMDEAKPPFGMFLIDKLKSEEPDE